VIAVELRKLVRRPRTWVSIGLLCALPTLVAVFLAVTEVGPDPGEEPAFLAAVLSNGSLFPAAALAIVLPIFLPVVVAMLAGEAVAGEAGAGMLRYLLIRPVSRTRLLVAKLLALVLFVLVAVAAVVGTGYLVGVSLFETQPGGTVAITSVSGVPMSRTELALRITGAMLYVGVSMLGLGAVALFLSTVTESPLAATLGALAAMVTSQILVTLDAAGGVRPYLPTRYWLAWIDFFRDPIAWRDIERGIGIQAVYLAVFLAAAWANFATKDVKT
jgi:ABC-2 type transport system permease protein